MRLIFVGLFLLTIFSDKLLAMGQVAQMVETGSEAAIWERHDHMYLRFSINELAGLRNKKNVWAGFEEIKPGVFKGEVVTDRFQKDERRFPARATLIDSSASASFYRIEILNSAKTVIKEFHIRGPAKSGSRRMAMD